MAWTNGGATRTATPTHRAFRRDVLKRDNNTCQRCGHHDTTGRTLEANHIINTKRGGTDHPDNGSTLCVDCHKIETQREAAEGRALKSRRRPAERHPGLI